jgi:hypothetical protein
VWDFRLGHNSHSHPLAVLRGCEVLFAVSTAGHDQVSGVFYSVELSYTDDGVDGQAPPLTARTAIRLQVE